ncbi:MAG: phospholipase D-like domain-containing protein, partial [Candidatus Saccharimonas sp.]
MFTRRQRFVKRIAIWMTAFLCMLGLVMSAAAVGTAQAAPKNGGIISPWSPPPSKSLYNVPKTRGTSAQVYTYVNELVRAINATPRGEFIRLSTFLTSYKPVVDALLKAHRRGVHVRFITWQEDYRKDKKILDTLKHELGTNIRALSYLKICHKSCYSNSGTQHAKIVLISRIINKTGKGVKYVSFIASGNITTDNVVNSWNHAQLITGRKKLYNGLVSYFDGMRYDRTHKNFKPVTDGAYTVYFYPTSKPFNPFYDALNHTTCKAAKRFGNNGRTVIRIAMYLWRNNTDYIAKRLATLAKQGCDVGVVVAKHPTEEKIISILKKGRVSLFNARGKKQYVHAKMGIISGTVSGKSVDMVVTGSLNFTRSSMVDCTDIALRMY